MADRNLAHGVERDTTQVTLLGSDSAPEGNALSPSTSPWSPWSFGPRTKGFGPGTKGSGQSSGRRLPKRALLAQP